MNAAHNIERNTVKEIMRECIAKKITINENFVTYFVNLLLLDPNWGITDDFLTSRENVSHFVGKVMSQLEDQHNPKIVTLQMQFYFTCNMNNIVKVVSRNRADILDRLVRLKDDIFKTTQLETQEDIDGFTKKIVYYIILVTGLGNPKLPQVYTETVAVFKSVMNESEITEFLEWSKDEKETQLDLVIKVVCGIRLFNKDCDKGSAGIEDLPGLLEKALKSIKDDVHTTLLAVMDKVNLLTTIVDKCYVLRESDGENKMACKLPTDMDDSYIDHAKDLLIFFRQYEFYIRKILEELDNISEVTYTVQENFADILKQIHDAIFMRIAIPANIIFPFFESLAKIWTDFQDQVVLLAKYSQIVINLDIYCKNIYYNKELLENMIGNDFPLTDAERLEKTGNFIIESTNEKVEISMLEDFENIDDIQLQFLGFCCWKLVETKGGLLPGNPGMGVAAYCNRNYVFSIPEASTEFSRVPEQYVMKVLDLGRKMPHLINFLFLKDQLKEVVEIRELAEMKHIATMSEDKEIQSEDFKDILPENIDRTYYWNIWDYKRQALKLADISKRKTVSTQTIRSNFRNTINVQTYEKREKIIQTKIDNYTNVPTPSNFIYGLRGRKDDQQFIIDLTRPVKE